MSYNGEPCAAQPLAASVNKILLRCILNMDCKSDQKACIMDALANDIFSEEMATMLIQNLDLANA